LNFQILEDGQVSLRGWIRPWQKRSGGAMVWRQLSFSDGDACGTDGNYYTV